MSTNETTPALDSNLNDQDEVNFQDLKDTTRAFITGKVDKVTSGFGSGLESLSKFGKDLGERMEARFSLGSMDNLKDATKNIGNSLMRRFSNNFEGLTSKFGNKAPEPLNRLDDLFEDEDIQENEKALLMTSLNRIGSFDAQHPGMTVDYYKSQHNRIFTEITKDAAGLDKKPQPGNDGFEDFMDQRKKLIEFVSYVNHGDMTEAELLLGEDVDRPDWMPVTKTDLPLNQRWGINMLMARATTFGQEAKEFLIEEDKKNLKRVAIGTFALVGVWVSYHSLKNGFEFGGSDAIGLAEGGMSGGAEGAADALTPNADSPFGVGEAVGETEQPPSIPDADYPQPEAAETVTSESQNAVDIIAEGENSITEIVARGEGLTDQLIDIANHLDADLSPSESYDLYQYLRAEGLFDGMLADGTLYEMPNGDLGIQNAGNLQLDRDLLEGIDSWLQRRG